MTALVLPPPASGQPASGQGVCGDDITARAKRGVVELVWSPVEGAAAAQYEVSRGGGLTGPFGVIGSTTSTYATYLDTTAPADVLLYYRITALDAAGGLLCTSPVVAALAPTGRTRMAVVPDVTGNPQAAGEAMLTAAQLVTGAVGTVADGSVPPGTVTGQDPPGGSFVPRASAVALTVAVAPPPVDACAGFVPQPTACGVGVCAAAGETTCTDVAGQQTIGDTCAPGNPGAEVCDGLDNDCNGAVDDGIAPTPTQCGVGACVAAGEQACVNGQWVDTCAPGNPGAEVCDGLDNDCNGAVDDGIAPVVTGCGVGACAAAGELTCVAGALVDSCTPGAPSAEVCADGLDNDCDGLTDLADMVDCPPVDACAGFVPQPTACGVGVCTAAGETTCTDVAGQQTIGDTCAPGNPNAEVCDGLDNDCDGAVDNGIAPTPTQCGVGACAAAGEQACVNGQMVDTCVAGNPGAEVCDGLDNDCDGAVDNGIAPTPTQCGVGACVAAGELACANGQLVDTCVAGNPGAEVCDGLDNDCDGAVDNGIAPTPTQCGVGACAAAGEQACVNGQMVDSCVAGNPGAEMCDGLDNDCDGAVDNGIAPTPTQCGVGACAAAGEQACVNGQMVDTCVAGNPGAEMCDGLDNDCDGAVDNGIAPTPTQCGVGACVAAGELTCVAGALVDSCTPGAPSAEVCADGLDNDCNGLSDGGDPACAVGAPATARLTLSQPDVIPTQAKGGSVEAICRVFDAAGAEIIPPPPVALSTNAADAVVAGGNVFAFPTPGGYTITCQVDLTAITASAPVVVLDEAIDPRYSELAGSLAGIEAEIAAAIAADQADDLVGLQAAKDALNAMVGAVDLAGLAATPPVLTGADVPTEAELLAAGDVPDPAVDDPFKAAVQAIEQNFLDYAALLASITPATATQADVDALNALTAAGEALATTLEGLADPSQTAVLAVNGALNNIVANLLPNQAVAVGQYAVALIDTVSGIVGLPLGTATPAQMYAGLTLDRRGPEAFYSATQKSFLVGLMVSQSIANGLRSQYIKRVYKPIMSHIAKNLWVLRQMNLLPSGMDPPILDFVFGEGSAASTIFEGGTIQCWGANFDPLAANNTIRVISQNGTFDIIPYLVQIDSASFDIMEGNLPSGMSGHPFGLPGAGLVRIITPGGTSGDVGVNVFP